MDGSNPYLQRTDNATNDFRIRTSKLRRSVLYIVRCPAAKTTTGEITASKYRSLAKVDVAYHQLMRMVVSPPADTNWASPWHELVQRWKNNVQLLSDYAGLKLWFVTCVEAAWKFASYVATLPAERWTRRILEWNITGRRKRGRPAYTWETALERHCSWKNFDNWIVEAAAYGH